MISADAMERTVSFVRGLLNDNGGYGSDVAHRSATLQNTLSAVKTLHMLEATPEQTEKTAAFVVRCFDATTGGFAEQPPDENEARDWKASPLSTTRALITLSTLGRRDLLDTYLHKAMAYIAQNAAGAVDHFMAIAAWDECGANGPPPEPSVSFFWRERNSDGLFGDTPLANGIGAASLLRAGRYLPNLSAVVGRVTAGTLPSGGFSNDGETADLMTTYVAVRTLYLCNDGFDPKGVVSFVDGLRRDNGGYGAPGSAVSDLNVTYMMISILDWAKGLHNALAVAEARRGDRAAIEARLRYGWHPDGKDPEGWTALLAAASHGQAAVVDLLLFHDIAGARRADPEIRFAPADGLPIFMAGQKGDVATVKLLLKANPQHLFSVAKVNGHTVLLQAAFYGLAPHRELAAYLLDSVGDILSIPESDREQREAAVKRLTTATYVRGLNALDIARFWGNAPMIALLSAYPQPTAEEKQAYFEALKAEISPPAPTDPMEKKRAALTEQMIGAIRDGLAAAEKVSEGEDETFSALRDSVEKDMRTCIDDADFQIDRLGNYLQETPIIVALTGHDANEYVALLRKEMVALLLDSGADPDKPEKHPMGVDAIIRAAVLHHFEVLQLIASHMRPEAFTSALNTRPGVNGQTALYDTVHQTLKATRATLSGYLSQISWCIERGADPTICEFTGKTISDLTAEASADPATRENAVAVEKLIKPFNTK